MSVQTPLANGDYLLKIKPDGNKLKPRREYTLFHVGSLPRVMGIGFSVSQKKAGTPLQFDRVSVAISEKVDATKMKVTMESYQSSAFKQLVISNVGGTVFQLPGPLDLKSKFRVTVDAEVGALSGVKLDGKYTGVAGSGPFTATFVPEDHVKKDAWVPDLTF